MILRLQGALRSSPYILKTRNSTSSVLMPTAEILSRVTVLVGNTTRSSLVSRFRDRFAEHNEPIRVENNAAAHRSRYTANGAL